MWGPIDLELQIILAFEYNVAIEERTLDFIVVERGILHWFGTFCACFSVKIVEPCRRRLCEEHNYNNDNRRRKLRGDPMVVSNKNAEDRQLLWGVWQSFGNLLRSILNVFF